MDHVIAADDSDDFEIHSTWLDWTMTLGQLFDHQDTKQILELVSQIRSTITGAFNASKLLQQLDALDKPFQADHWLFSMPAAMIGIVCLINLIILACCKTFCAKSSPSEPLLPTLSAPALPPTAMQYNVGIQPTPMNFTKAAAPKSIAIINS
jgi:hypothetical protein